jgi:hypothetical protein
MQPRLYLKESELRNIPSSFTHRLLPILFADTGSMVASTGKRKKCGIVVTLAGLSLFRPEKGRRLKVAEFAPTYDITEITYADPKRRQVITKNESFYFITEHAEEAVAWLVAARNALVPDLPIRLTKFPVEVRVPPIEDFIKSQSISQLRYVALCCRSQIPPAENLIDFFRELTAGHDTIYFEESFDAPFDLKCLLNPLRAVDGFRVLHCRGFAPLIVCRIVHHLVKHSKSLRTVILEDYSTLIPQQLRFDGLKFPPNESLSLVFSRVILPEQTFQDLMQCLAKFAGEYQRLSFNGMRMTNQVCKLLFGGLKKMRCCRTLEMFELDSLVADSCPTDRICRRITGLLRRCRFLTSISLSHPAQAMTLQLRCFANGNMLTELSLCKQDLSQALMNADFPPRLQLLTFAESSFTFGSLQSLFQLLSKPREPLSLILRDISIPNLHWPSFFDGLDGFPPILCLNSLDWSGNQIPKAGIESFCHYFFSGNPMKFVAIDRVFKTSLLSDLEKFVGLLPVTLWGLSLGGDANNNINGSLKYVVLYLNRLQNLRMLHLNGQKLSEADIGQLRNFLNTHRMIAEVSFDDTDMSSAPVLADTYRAIEQLQIPCIGRPFADCRRLQLSSGNSPQMLQVLRTALRNAAPASDGRIRAAYFRQSPDRFDARQYQQFVRDFPMYCFRPDSHLSPFPCVAASPAKSLLQLQSKTKFDSLNELHVPFLSSPFEPPPWAPGDAVRVESGGHAKPTHIAIGRAQMSGRRAMTIVGAPAPVIDMTQFAKARVGQSAPDGSVLSMTVGRYAAEAPLGTRPLSMTGGLSSLPRAVPAVVAPPQQNGAAELPDAGHRTVQNNVQPSAAPLTAILGPRPSLAAVSFMPVVRRSADTPQEPPQCSQSPPPLPAQQWTASPDPSLPEMPSLEASSGPPPPAPTVPPGPQPIVSPSPLSPQRQSPFVPAVPVPSLFGPSVIGTIPPPPIVPPTPSPPGASSPGPPPLQPMPPPLALSSPPPPLVQPIPPALAALSRPPPTVSSSPAPPTVPSRQSPPTVSSSLAPVTLPDMPYFSPALPNIADIPPLQEPASSPSLSAIPQRPGLSLQQSDMPPPLLEPPLQPPNVPDIPPGPPPFRLLPNVADIPPLQERSSPPPVPPFQPTDPEFPPPPEQSLSLREVPAILPMPETSPQLPKVPAVRPLPVSSRQPPVVPDVPVPKNPEIRPPPIGLPRPPIGLSQPPPGVSPSWPPAAYGMSQPPAIGPDIPQSGPRPLGPDIPLVRERIPSQQVLAVPEVPPRPAASPQPPVKLDKYNLEIVEECAMPDDSVDISTDQVVVPPGCQPFTVDLMAREDPEIV